MSTAYVRQRLARRYARWITPASTAALVSFALSLAASAGGTINRDGMLYVDTARIFIEHGFAAARANFAWPFLSVFIAATSTVTGLPLETAGYLLNAVFMAGASAFLVAAAARSNPRAAWTICLVVLALPGVNEYRSELLREFGCWFFVMAAFWLAQRWSACPGWSGGLLVQGLIGAASLFRPEAMAMIPALVAWQLCDAPQGERIRRALMVGGAALLGLLGLIALYLGGHLAQGSRLSSDLAHFSVARFDAKAEMMSAAFIEYARGQARTILFFGSLAIIPVKFIHKLGLLVVPLAFFPFGGPVRAVLRQYGIYAWGFVAHLLVLAAFVLDMQFLAGRYVGLLLLCSAPFLGVATWQLTQRFGRWRFVAVASLLLVMAGSTVSLGGGKTHFVAAGRWLAQNAQPSPRTFVGSGRASYYAGWGYQDVHPTPETLAAALGENRYDLYVLEVPRGESAIGNWIARSGLRPVARFADARGNAVVVIAAEAGSNRPPAEDKDAAAK